MHDGTREGHGYLGVESPPVPTKISKSKVPGAAVRPRDLLREGAIMSNWILNRRALRFGGKGGVE
jgi:hypothetical protein